MLYKSIQFFFVVILFVCCSKTPPPNGDSNLVWSDEFEGTALNLSNWNYQMGTGTAEGLVGWGNNELQYYTSRAKNVKLNNGILSIVAEKESYQGSGYTSARLNTKGKRDFKYGRIEARIRLPKGQGYWPAFWMLPTDNVYGGWPRSGEIDIMEAQGQDEFKIHGTIHYGKNFEERRYSTKITTLSRSYSEDFHVYAIEWRENGIKWFIDDMLYNEVSASDIQPDRWVFDQEFHILLNVAVGGNFVGSPDANTQFPQSMDIDWVRVYEIE